MGFWNRLFGKRQPADLQEEDQGWATLKAQPLPESTSSARQPSYNLDDYPTHVVGESHYQSALEMICGGKQEYGRGTWTDEVQLIPYDDNPYDKNAVRVDIDGNTVGHLKRADAVLYRQKYGKSVLPCEAIIVGGWDRGDEDRGNFGVRLNFRL